MYVGIKHPRRKSLLRSVLRLQILLRTATHIVRKLQSVMHTGMNESNIQENRQNALLFMYPILQNWIAFLSIQQIKN